MTANIRHIPLALFLAFAVVVCMPNAASAQTASEYFHGGAQAFIGEDLDEAASTVRSGLAAFPEDAQLLELQRLIEEAQEQQQQQDQGQNDEQEQSEGQDSENQEEGEQGDPSEQDQQGNESESDQEEEDSEQQEPQEQDGEEGNQGEEDEQQSEDPSDGEPSEAPVNPDRLSEQEAERILQALANEEEQLLREVQKIKGRPRRVEKDW